MADDDALSKKRTHMAAVFATYTKRLIPDTIEMRCNTGEVKRVEPLAGETVNAFIARHSLEFGGLCASSPAEPEYYQLVSIRSPGTASSCRVVVPKNTGYFTTGYSLLRSDAYDNFTRCDDRDSPEMVLTDWLKTHDGQKRGKLSLAFAPVMWRERENPLAHTFLVFEMQDAEGKTTHWATTVFNLGAVNDSFDDILEKIITNYFSVGVDNNTAFSFSIVRFSEDKNVFGPCTFSLTARANAPAFRCPSRCATFSVTRRPSRQQSSAATR
jgi:hypothetical protein